MRFREFIEGSHPDRDEILKTLSMHPQGLSPFQLAEMVWGAKPGDRSKALAMDHLLEDLWQKGLIGLSQRRTYYPKSKPVAKSV